MYPWLNHSFLCFPYRLTSLSAIVMKDFIGKLPSETRHVLHITFFFYLLWIVLSFVALLPEHYQVQGKLKEVESCLVHLDVTNLDIDQVWLENDLKHHHS